MFSNRDRLNSAFYKLLVGTDERSTIPNLAELKLFKLTLIVAQFCFKFRTDKKCPKRKNQTMIVLRSLKMYLYFLGYSTVCPNFETSERLSINVLKNCITFSALLFFFVPPFVFFIFVASNFSEFSEAFFFASAAFLLLTLYIVFSLDKRNIEQLIKNLEQIIGTSEVVPSYIFFRHAFSEFQV